MLGFLIGTACLIGLVKVVRGGCGPGYGRWGYFGHHGPWGGGGRWMFRRLFERLDATPGQEKVILNAVDEVRKAWARRRDELEKSRADIARALRGEHFDQASVREMFARQDAALEEIRKTLTGELAKVHEVLDERQRREVADLLEHGWGYGRGCGGGWGWGRWRRGGDEQPHFV